MKFVNVWPKRIVDGEAIEGVLALTRDEITSLHKVVAKASTAELMAIDSSIDDVDVVNFQRIYYEINKEIR